METDVNEEKRKVRVGERDPDYQSVTGELRVEGNNGAIVSVCYVARDSGDDACCEGGDLRLDVVGVVGVEYFMIGEGGAECVVVVGEELGFLNADDVVRFAEVFDVAEGAIGAEGVVRKGGGVVGDNGGARYLVERRKNGGRRRGGRGGDLVQESFDAALMG